MNHDMTGREFEEAIERRDAYYREGMIVGLCLAALSGAIVGAAFGYLARGWLL